MKTLSKLRNKVLVSQSSDCKTCKLFRKLLKHADKLGFSENLLKSWRAHLYLNS